MKQTNPILVLGSNSFSAANFIDHLLTLGKKVIGVSRSDEVPTIFRVYFNNHNLNNFTFYKIDLNTDVRKIARLVYDYEIQFIVNFAAQSMVEQSWQSPEDWYQTNLVGLTQLSNLLVKAPSVKKFIHFTTPEVYGTTNDWIKESFKFSPSTPYAVSRAAGDWHLRCLFENYGFPVIFTRAANVYGPGQQLHRVIPRTVISILTKNKFQLHGGGKSLRSFIHMSDVSSALVSVLDKAHPGESYHISTEEIISILDLVKMLAHIKGVSHEALFDVVPERTGKDLAYKLSSEKIRYELGWQDKVSLEEGLQSVLFWASANLSELKSLPLSYKHKR